MKTMRLRLLAIALVWMVLVTGYVPQMVYAQNQKMVKTSMGVYSHLKTIDVSFQGANYTNNAWIGIYKAGTKPGKTAALAYKYVKSASGTIYFTLEDFMNFSSSPQRGLPLERGKYQVYLFDSNQYNYTAAPYTFWIDGSDPKYSFDVFSDLHIGANPNYNASSKLRSALIDLTQYSPASKRLIINGDCVDTCNDYSTLKGVIEGIKEGTTNIGYLPSMTFNLGNHELYTNVNQKYSGSYANKLNAFKNNIAGINLKNKSSSCSTFGNYAQNEKPYFKYEESGCYFLFLAAEDYPGDSGLANISLKQVNWVYNQLNYLTKKNPDAPIFVFLHETLKGTVAQTANDEVTQATKLKYYLNSYPTVTLFTSHSHNDSTSGAWVYEEPKASKLQSGKNGPGMTVLNTSSVGWVYRNGQSYGSAPYSQGLHVDVFDNWVIIRSRDLANHKWLSEYRIDLTKKRQSLADSNL